MLFNYFFFLASNNILQYFLFILIIIGYSFIPAVIAQISNSIVKLTIPIGIPSNEVKTEIGIHLVTTQDKIIKYSINLELYKPFCASFSSIYFGLFL